MLPAPEKVNHVLRYIIMPALDAIGHGGRSAYELVLGTGLKESHYYYRRQLGNGPARGWWQMEPATFKDIWDNYLRYKPQLRESMLRLIDHEKPDPDILVENDFFAAAMCRVHYLRVPSRLPPPGDVCQQANYWKQYYNTPLGKGAGYQYIDLWKHCVDYREMSKWV